jgi:fatty-acid desaturase
LIHNAFDCPAWLERVFAYLGTLVSMGGPKGMIRQHDLRDWAQRKPDCHPFLSHKASVIVDILRQLHFNLVLQNPPQVIFEQNVENDRFYCFLDRYLLSQQLPWAVLFYAIGGMPWVLWGICVRCAVSLTGHWLVVHLAHNHGAEDWHVEGAGVQGSNVPYASWLTWGESYHNNHHAFPGSAVMALEEGQADPGWWVLRQLERCGLVWNLQSPDTLPERHALRRLHSKAPIVSQQDTRVVVNKS